MTMTVEPKTMVEDGGWFFLDDQGLSSKLPVSIRGQVLNSANGLPLPDMFVVMHSARKESKQAPDGRQAEDLILGEAVTDKSGNFDISFRKTRAAYEELLLLAQSPDTAYVLKVAESRGKAPFAISKPYSAGADGNMIVLGVDLGREELPPG